MAGCRHPEDQQVRTVYYVLCGACGDVLLVSYCNYSVECHPQCALPAVCVQSAREKYHAGVKLRVPSNLLAAARARQQARNTAE